MTLSDLGQHASEDLQAEVLFVPKAVRPALDDPDLGIDSLDEPERELLLRLAVRRDPAPVPLHQRGELLEGFESLPFEGFFPVVEEPPCPPFAAVPPQLIERFLEKVGRLEIPNKPDLVVVEGAVNRPASAADRFFSLRSRLDFYNLFCNMLI